MNSVSDLPVTFRTPAGEADGNYTLNLTASTGTETVKVVVGTFTYDNTPSSTGGGGSRRRGGGGSFTIVNTTPVNETPEPIVITEVAPTPVEPTPEPVAEPEGNLIVEDNETTNELTGQFTGSDDESPSLAWLWWLIALIIAAILIWKLAGKGKSTSK